MTSSLRRFNLWLNTQETDNARPSVLTANTHPGRVLANAHTSTLFRQDESRRREQRLTGRLIDNRKNSIKCCYFHISFVVKLDTNKKNDENIQTHPPSPVTCAIMKPLNEGMVM